MAKKIWYKSYYRRNDGSYRQRGTGNIIALERKGQKSRVKFLGLEKPRSNNYGYDPHLNLRTQKKIRVHVRENNPFSRKRRKSHNRTLR